MKHSKKIVLGILVLALLFSCFTGCGKKEVVNADIATKEELDPKVIGDYGDLKLPIDDEYTTITILKGADTDTLNDSPVFKELRRRTGLNVQAYIVPASTAGEKAKTLLASKENMPDIFGVGLSVDEQNEFGMQGAFIRPAVSCGQTL